MRRTLSTFNEVWQQQFRHRVLAQTQHFPEQAQFLIGCSGGMDSMRCCISNIEIFPTQTRSDLYRSSITADERCVGNASTKQSEVLNILVWFRKSLLRRGI